MRRDVWKYHIIGLENSRYALQIFTVRWGFGQVRSVFTPMSLKREQGVVK